MQGDGVEVVVPRRASERDVNRFIERNQGWIEQRLNARPKRITFTPGAVIPFQGVPHSLELTGALRGGVQVEDGTIRIACLAEHMPRRMRTWLTAQAARGTIRQHRAARGGDARVTASGDDTRHDQPLGAVAAPRGRCPSRGG